MAQVCGIQSFVFDDGPGRGVRGLEFRTGSGLRFVALADRAMDISFAEFRGVPLCWVSGTGPVAPAFYSPHGWEWLRSFFGGLLTTCGLSNVGDPCEDRGAYLATERFGAHGRISSTPARGIGYASGWEGERYLMTARGEMVETAAQGEKLALRRVLAAEMGRNSFTVSDTVTNEGYTRVPFELLYHVNLGYPLLDAGSRILARCSSVAGLDESSARGADKAGILGRPAENAPEEVFLLDMLPGADGVCSVALVNPGFDAGRGLGVFLRYPGDSFPYFHIWKRLAQREYVLGFEPGNCTVQGRVRQRERGDLRHLRPLEEARSSLELGVLASNDEIDAFARAHRLAPL
jgi:hypothetical protein